jgi:transcriptional regulator with XRE-family HTH domain
MKCKQSYEVPGLIRLSEFIRARREELHMSQPQLAKAAGLGSAEFLSMVEHRIRRLGLHKVMDVATALRIDTNSFLRLAFFERYPREAVALFGQSLQTYLPRVKEPDSGG